MIFESIQILLSPINLFFLLAGTILAMVVSFLPGIGMSSVASIFLLLTLDWEITTVLTIFGAFVGGATFMGSVTGILFNIPGGAPSAAILFDGYPLSQKGYTKKTIAAAATASAVGSIIGVMILLLILPIIKPYLLMFGPLERFAIVLWGMVGAIFISKHSIVDGFILVLMGLILAMIGVDGETGVPRLTMGIDYLHDGIDPIIFLLGFFAISEVFQWNIRALSKSNHLSSVLTASDDSIKSGIISVFTYKWLTLKSAIIGCIVGMMPGVGGTVASLMAYSYASSTEKKDNEFGSGDIRGVIAPEAAVDAKDGGSLLPALLFGLPGSEVGIILITLFNIHGLVAGSMMLSTHIGLTYILIFALLISNLLTSFIGLTLIGQFIKIKKLELKNMSFYLLALLFTVTYFTRDSFVDVVAVIFFGLLGVLFNKYKLSKVPFLIAFIMGDLLESNLLLSEQILNVHELDYVARPFFISIVGLIIISIIFLYIQKKKIETDQSNKFIRIRPFIVLIIGFLILLMTIQSQNSYSLMIFLLFLLTLVLQSKYFYKAKVLKL